jgi:hypothetical protein
MRASKDQSLIVSARSEGPEPVMNRLPVEPQEAMNPQAGDLVVCRPGIQGRWFDMELLRKFLHRQ